jgi:hypothetical protein
MQNHLDVPISCGHAYMALFGPTCPCTLQELQLLTQGSIMGNFKKEKKENL